MESKVRRVYLHRQSQSSTTRCVYQQEWHPYIQDAEQPELEFVVNDVRCCSVECSRGSTVRWSWKTDEAQPAVARGGGRRREWWRGWRASWVGRTTSLGGAIGSAADRSSLIAWSKSTYGSCWSPISPSQPSISSIPSLSQQRPSCSKPRLRVKPFTGQHKQPTAAKWSS